LFALSPPVPVSFKPAASARRLFASPPICHGIRVIDDLTRPICVNAFLLCINELPLGNRDNRHGSRRPRSLAMATNFKQKEAAEFLMPEKLERYQAEMAYFHDKLSSLHHNVYFVQKIIDFPFDLFVMPYSDYFLKLVIDNFLQMSVLQITKLMTDGGHSARKITKFRTFMDSAVRDEFKADYRKALAEVRFKPRFHTLVGKAKDLRDKHIAHSAGEPVAGLSFEEIKEITQELTNLFNAASFDTEYRYLLLAYDPTVQHAAGRDGRPDIERILEGIARDSPVLSEPESNPVAWPHLRSGWSDKKAEQFNHYRRKFGLADV
jgi:hypothetical protein